MCIAPVTELALAKVFISDVEPADIADLSVDHNVFAVIAEVDAHRDPRQQQFIEHDNMAARLLELAEEASWLTA